jgi:hypothetical protein
VVVLSRVLGGSGAGAGCFLSFAIFLGRCWVTSSLARYFGSAEAFCGWSCAAASWLVVAKLDDLCGRATSPKDSASMWLARTGYACLLQVNVLLELLEQGSARV